MESQIFAHKISLEQVICIEDHIVMFLLEVYLEIKGLYQEEINQRLTSFSMALACYRIEKTRVLKNLSEEDLQTAYRYLHFFGEKLYDKRLDLVEQVIELEKKLTQ